jgi:hypothetical protein
LAPEVKEQGVLDAQVWGAGLVVLTKRFQFCLVQSIDEPRPVMLAPSGLPSAPTSWTVIEPQFTAHGSAEGFSCLLFACLILCSSNLFRLTFFSVLAAHPNGSILVIDPERTTDRNIKNGPFTRMTVSPTGKILATYNTQGQLWVVTTDFAQNLSEFSVKNKSPPAQLVWCGVESVVCHWEGLLLMVGPMGDHLKVHCCCYLLLFVVCNNFHCC